MKNLITIEELKEILTYDSESGVFSWNRTGTGRSGKIAGTSSGGGYQQITIKRRKYLSHRLAWFFVNNEWPTLIDHIDGDGMNNKICNLRIVTHSQNTMNCKINKNSRSGVNGVSFCNKKKKWTTYIQSKGKTIHLGRFVEKDDAIKSRRAAENQIFGTFCRQHS